MRVMKNSFMAATPGEDDFQNPEETFDLLPSGKERITIRLDREVLDYFRRQVEERGGGSYQTLINQALREYILGRQVPLVRTLRRVVREELASGGELVFPAGQDLFSRERPDGLVHLKTGCKQGTNMRTFVERISGRNRPAVDDKDKAQKIVVELTQRASSEGLCQRLGGWLVSAAMRKPEQAHTGP